MPRLSSSVPKYRLHKASGQAIVAINGRRHYLGPFKSKASKLEYDRVITEWLSSGRSPSYGVPEHVVTVLELIVSYLEYAKAYYGDGPRSSYQNMLYAVKPLRKLYSNLPAREFTPRHLRAVREKMIALGWSRKYVNSNVQKIVRAFRWGVAEGLVPVEVPQALGMLQGLRRGHASAHENEKVRPVADDLVDAALQFMPPVVRAMIELNRGSGMRPGELCILRPCDIDRSGAVWEYRPSSHKNANREKDRVVYFGPSAKAILAPFLLRDAEAFCFSPAESVAQMRVSRNAARKTPKSCGNAIGTNRKRKPKRIPGNRYTTSSLYAAVRRACDKAFPVPEEIAGDAEAVAKWQKEHRWAPNRIRHALGTKVRREFDLESSRVMLGHSKASMTEHYAELDRERAIVVAGQIG